MKIKDIKVQVFEPEDHEAFARVVAKAHAKAVVDYLRREYPDRYEEIIDRLIDELKK